MPRFARRLDALPPFLFAELQRRIAEKRRLGIDVITLGSADPDTPTAAPVVAEMQRQVARPEHHRYPANAGLPGFRQAVRDFMAARFGVALDADREIIPVLGGKEAIHHLGLLCLEPGTLCLMPDPGYPVYSSAAILAGADTHVLPLDEEHGFLPDLDRVPADVARRATLLFINYPNNPTGAVAGAGFYERVVDFARRHDIVVVSDLSYSEITFDGYDAPSFLATPGAKEVGVEVFSLSKGWNMTGWRAGWLAGNAEIIRRYLHLKPNIDSGMFGAMQHAVIAGLTEARDFPREMSRLYQARRDLMASALEELGLKVRRPKATPFLWIRNPGGYGSTALADLFLDRAGVVVSPGSAFGSSGEGYFRISLTSPDARLREAAERMKVSLRF